jgi:multidrug efflux system membrane fusion protein
VVPSQALQMGQQGHFIFVVGKDLTVESRDVWPGVQIDGQTVIEKGLAPGEEVVRDGQLRLFPGAKVVLRNDHPAGGDSRP